MPSGGRILDPGDDSTIVDPPHSQPWVVNVADFCSGTLISKRHVITSGHCGFRPPPDYVEVGEHNRMNETDGQERIEVIKRIPYPGYEYDQLVCGKYSTIPPQPQCNGDDLMILESENNNVVN